ncbi:MAG: A/G-specific adenine glycosylase [Rhodospirillales bacterium]|nr:A/G-specific adenine glycosylase [Rhodospirillales bacterium]MCB9964909.1 A/G-specific adenine glycosylase [Rhodospirillales bacterium]MCB9973702.1 A/G-specific adenine glycosylase [Rhodospirillales bacterium]
MHTIDVPEFRTLMLGWYKHHARILPWRAKFGEFPNPYHEWLSEIMLQQTVVKAVIPYFHRFTEIWPGIEDLAAAPLEYVMKEWAGLGYYARARNLHKCAQVVTAQHDGLFPQDEKELKTLPGIGPYTAAAISAIAFGNPAVVMDGNVERVVARLFAHEAPLKEKESKKALYAYTASLTTPQSDHHAEFAQAMMELGALICTPTSPQCGLCPVRNYCKSAATGRQDQIPIKALKTPKPQRYGAIFFIERKKKDQKELLLERRPHKGLLAGMVGFPGSLWEVSSPRIEDFPGAPIPGFEVRHTFTHFHLSLQGYIVPYESLATDLAANCFWHNISECDTIGLPSLYKKAFQQYMKYRQVK